MGFGKQTMVGWKHREQLRADRENVHIITVEMRCKQEEGKLWFGPAILNFYPGDEEPAVEFLPWSDDFGIALEIADHNTDGNGTEAKLVDEEGRSLCICSGHDESREVMDLISSLYYHQVDPGAILEIQTTRAQTGDRKCLRVKEALRVRG